MAHLRWTQVSCTIWEKKLDQSILVNIAHKQYAHIYGSDAVSKTGQIWPYVAYKIVAVVPIAVDAVYMKAPSALNFRLWSYRELKFQLILRYPNMVLNVMALKIKSWVSDIGAHQVFGLINFIIKHTLIHKEWSWAPWFTNWTAESISRWKTAKCNGVQPLWEAALESAPEKRSKRNKSW